MKYEFGINDFENSVFSNQNAEKKTISAKKTIEFSDSRSRYCKIVFKVVAVKTTLLLIESCLASFSVLFDIVPSAL